MSVLNIICVNVNQVYVYANETQFGI